MKWETVIPAQTGTSFKLDKKDRLKVIDLEGGQVADLLAFNSGDYRESLSTAATIDCNGSIHIRPGDHLYSNRYNPLLLLAEDTAGAHDLLHPPCSPAMFRAQYGIDREHPSCYHNFLQVLRKYGLDESSIGPPFNIFMNTNLSEAGRVEVKEPLSGPGDYIVLEAQKDLLVAVTACSVEESACNAYKCTSIGLEIC